MKNSVDSERPLQILLSVPHDQAGQLVRPVTKSQLLLVLRAHQELETFPPIQEGDFDVERVPDPVDGRAKLVRYTERGREVDRVARQTVLRLEEEWARRLGARKLEHLRRLLQELIAELEQDP